jgi:RhtB (resistance to homoserine/threonine) family protein
MLDQLLVIVSVTFLVMLTPGPDMVLVVRNTFVGGRRAGLQTSAGILSGNLVHITYCVLGIGVLISQSIVAYSALKYAGAAYLVYLGIVSFRSGGTTPGSNSIPDQRPTERAWFVQGLVNNLLNPKGTLFYLGVFTVVITPDTPAAATLLLIVTMMLVSASFWLFFVYTLDRRPIRSFIERSQRTVNRVLGALLILLGLRVASLSR